MTTQNVENTDTQTAATNRPRRSARGILKGVLIGLTALIAVFAAFIATRPGEFRISRSTTIAAAPSEVFAHVNDFHKWDAWSPWAKIDPAAKNSFEGAPEGTGAIFKWSGNHDVGEGSMTLTESHPHDLIRIRLDFIKPLEDTANVEFTFQPVGEQTAVTWSMEGKNNFIGRIVCLFMNMEQMIGSKYEEGLASLKSIVEAAPKEGKPTATESTTETEQTGSEK